MNILSLFDGISCGYLAGERAGLKIDNYYAYEIDENAIKISRKNYPQIIQCGDVTTEDFTKYEGKIDLLIGGSPCQGFSTLGQRMNFNDSRSRLFWIFVKALKEAKPKYFLLENVKMKKEWRDVISNELGVEPILINSALVSAQIRNRLYWSNIPNITQPEDKEIKLCDVIDIKNRQWKPFESQNWLFTYWGDKPKWKKLNRLNRNKCNTLTTGRYQSNNFYLNDENNAVTVFTNEEAEKLQTLPIGYTADCGVPKEKAFKAIGNSWTVDVIAHILRGLNNE